MFRSPGRPCAPENPGSAKLHDLIHPNSKPRLLRRSKDFSAEDFLPKKEAKRTERFIAYAIAATRMALEDSGLVIDDTNAHRIGVITGCGLGGLSILEDTCITLKQKGPRRVSPFFIPMMIGNMAPGMISIQFGAKGPNASIATACAAGAHAVGDSFKIIQQRQSGCHDYRRC